MISISVFFLIAFCLATTFLLFHSTRQLIRGVDTDSVAAITLGLVMSVAAVFWARGMLDMMDARYSLMFKDGLMIWRESSARGSKEQKIPINQISGYGNEGDNKVGFSLLVQTSDKAHRLGTLLSLESLNQITALIYEQKQEAEQDGDGDAEEAV